MNKRESHLGNFFGVRATARGESGFTLVEALIAIGVSGIVILGASELVVMMQRSVNGQGSGAFHGFGAQGGQGLINKTASDTASKTFSQNMTGTISGADVAHVYQHLPIPVICPPPTVVGGVPTKTAPCVRQLDATTHALTDINSANPPPASLSAKGMQGIEFFNDENADLGSLASRGGIGTSSTAWIQGPTNLPLGSDVTTPSQNGNYFTTWPLVNQNSFPFVVMSNANMPFYFQFYTLSETGLSASSLAIQNLKSYAFFFTNVQISAAVKGLPLLIYNFKSPTQYAVQVIKDILDCSLTSPSTDTSQVMSGQGLSQCTQWVYWNSTSSSTGTTLPVINSFFVAPSGSQPKQAPFYYALQLESLSSSDAGFYKDSYSPQSVASAQVGLNPTLSSANGGTFVPSATDLGLSGANFTWSSPQANGSAGSAFYTFPTDVASLQDSSDITDLPSTQQGGKTTLDVRSLSHYYAVNSLRNPQVSNGGSLVAIPINITAYYLRSSNANPANPSTSLISAAYKYPNNSAGTRLGAPEIVMLDSVAGSVVFARQLGTSNIAVLMYQKALARWERLYRSGMDGSFDLASVFGSPGLLAQGSVDLTALGSMF